MKPEMVARIRRAVLLVLAIAALAGLVAGVVLAKPELSALGLGAMVLLVVAVLLGLRVRTDNLASSLTEIAARQQVLGRRLDGEARAGRDLAALVLRGYRDIGSVQRGHAESLRLLARNATEDAASVQESHAVLTGNVDALKERMVAVSERLEALDALLGEMSGRTADAVVAATQHDRDAASRAAGEQADVSRKLVALLDVGLAERHEMSDRLMRQVIRDTSALPERVQAALDQAAAQRQDKSDRLMRQVIRDTESLPEKLVGLVGAVPAEHRDLLEKLARQILREQTKVLEVLGGSEATSIPDRIQELESGSAKLQQDALEQIEALLQLHGLRAAHPPIPLLGGWAMEPKSMLAVVAELVRRKPHLVVECGSGSSTVWIARILRSNRRGRVVALEHLQKYADEGNQALEMNNLGSWADIRLAPIQPVQHDGKAMQWYATDAIRDLEQIDVLIVDGPPRSIGDHARYPALPLLRSRLAKDALIILDDVNRGDEKEVLALWQAEVEGLSEPVQLSARTIALEYSQP